MHFFATMASGDVALFNKKIMELDIMNMEFYVKLNLTFIISSSLQFYFLKSETQC